MQIGITINIVDYFPSDFDFTGFNFIFIYDSKQIDKEISYLKKNNIYHKLYIPSRRDIKYSVRMNRNESLIGICEFIIPFSIIHKKESYYEKICLITMTDSIKKTLFGSSVQNNQIKINIHTSINYISGNIPLKDRHLRKNKSNVNYENKILNTGKESELKSNRYFNLKSEINNNSISIKKERNNISNRNILKSHKIYLSNQNSNPLPHTQVVSPKKYLLYNIPSTELKKHSNININSELNKMNNTKEDELTEANLNEEDPNDRSRIDKDLENDEKYGENKLFGFINNLIKENPLSELDNKKDIGEMIIYTRDIISQLLDYQIKFYDTLKKSVEMNHKFNELLLKYNEKYRYITKKMNKLTEEMNTFDIKSDIIINNNKTEKNDINEMINLKNKELEIFKDLYKIQEEENLDTLNSNNNNDIKLKILINALQKMTSKYGPLNDLITKNNSSETDIQNLTHILDKYKKELNINLNINKQKSNTINIKGDIIINDENQIDNKNSNKNENEGLEYVLSDNPDELDKVLNKNLKNIYSTNKKISKGIFKRTGKNSYEFGNKKIIIKRDDNNIKVRIGGLFTSLDKFIESNSSNDLIRKNSNQKKLSNKLSNRNKENNK